MVSPQLGRPSEFESDTMTSATVLDPPALPPGLPPPDFPPPEPLPAKAVPEISITARSATRTLASSLRPGLSASRVGLGTFVLHDCALCARRSTPCKSNRAQAMDIQFRSCCQGAFPDRRARHLITPDHGDAEHRVMGPGNGGGADGHRMGADGRRAGS